jgi:hypothetical protein
MYPKFSKIASPLHALLKKGASISEKELLAIILGVKHFRPYLYGRKFNIACDHKPLMWIMNVKDPGSRLVRWRIKLEKYDYEIIYKKRAINTNADALSRINTVVREEADKEIRDASEEERC